MADIVVYEQKISVDRSRKYQLHRDMGNEVNGKVHRCTAEVDGQQRKCSLFHTRSVRCTSVHLEEVSNGTLAFICH